MEQTTRYVAAAGQFRPEYLDVRANVERIRDIISRARNTNQDVRLLVFPECATTGYVGHPSSLGDLSLVESFYEVAEPADGYTAAQVGAVSEAFSVYVALGFVERDPSVSGVFYNSSMLIGPNGELVGVHRKCFNSPSERSYFKTGSRADVFATPIGRLALSICYDFWFPELARIQARKGCEVHLNMTNNLKYYRVGSTHIPVARAAENAMYVVSCNRVGLDEPTGNTFAGHSIVVAPNGCVLGEAGDEEEILFGEIDLDEIVRTRLKTPVFKDFREDLYEAASKPSYTTT